MHVAAIIAAGGRGVRLGADRPKQFLELGGRSILDLSIDALVASDPRRLWNGGVGAGLAQLSPRELYSRLFRS